ncbi:alkylphosphonate utilization protein [Pseudohoeflea suaedae]|uniref:Alkylphosphonate utilization protein n=1 Tax=Pseudohoeflea suaedae TaxID=877384 RepID=A0A4R5PQN7_9HYPH|nr:alkylphosphonate utilization protein [Pseudohoeflea suaedae]MAZ82489.1 PhnA protein [Hoeflea sp.]MBG20748.1 PhnA protein [Hyphomicrobiales bacterium]MBG20917.1 PhnA protein [Hyphomicrobiales bacterium]TDH39011.1 alkylphosphonate utilization protein [Pseudohoeflea suaedae]|tara:strand:+ start:13015 stop:13233 length:219 start_codon:yes stop_codon:yes gene_type:complete
MSDETRDSNGAILNDGDNVTVIKDLKVKGTSTTIKRGTLVKGIRLTGDPDLIECRVEKVKGLVLRTEFLKKA